MMINIMETMAEFLDDEWHQEIHMQNHQLAYDREPVPQQLHT